MATIGVTRGLGDHDLKVYNSNIYIKPFLSCVPEVSVWRVRSSSGCQQRRPSLLSGAASATPEPFRYVWTAFGLRASLCWLRIHFSFARSAVSQNIPFCRLRYGANKNMNSLQQGFLHVVFKDIFHKKKKHQQSMGTESQLHFCGILCMQITEPSVHGTDKPSYPNTPEHELACMHKQIQTYCTQDLNPYNYTQHTYTHTHAWMHIHRHT